MAKTAQSNSDIAQKLTAPQSANIGTNDISSEVEARLQNENIQSQYLIMTALNDIFRRAHDVHKLWLKQAMQALFSSDDPALDQIKEILYDARLIDAADHLVMIADKLKRNTGSEQNGDNIARCVELYSYAAKLYAPSLSSRALDSFDKAIACDPYAAELQAMCGQYHRSLGNINLAEKYEAKAKQPNDTTHNPDKIHKPGKIHKSSKLKTKINTTNHVSNLALVPLTYSKNDLQGQDKLRLLNIKSKPA